MAESAEARSAAINARRSELDMRGIDPHEYGARPLAAGDVADFAGRRTDGPRALDPRFRPDRRKPDCLAPRPFLDDAPFVPDSCNAVNYILRSRQKISARPLMRQLLLALV